MLSTIMKKWYILLLCGIICSATLMIEKYYTTNFITKSGDYLFGYSLKIDDAQNNNPLRYSSYVKDPLNRKIFLDKSTRLFDYTKFDIQWNNKTFNQKCAWLDLHVKVHEYGNGYYSLLFILNSNDPKDEEYVEKNGKRYIDEYFLYINSIRPEDILQKSDYTEIKPVIHQISKASVLIKYGIIGFFLGIMVVMTALFGIKIVRRL